MPSRPGLSRQGHQFKSDTDTEALAHLIGDFYEKGKNRGGAANGILTQAVSQALREVIGHLWNSRCLRR